MACISCGFAYVASRAATDTPVGSQLGFIIEPPLGGMLLYILRVEKCLTAAGYTVEFADHLLFPRCFSMAAQVEQPTPDERTYDFFPAGWRLSEGVGRPSPEFAARHRNTLQQIRELAIDELLGRRGGRNALYFGLGDLSNAGMYEDVLRAWLDQPGDHVRLIDFLMLRASGGSPPTGLSWSDLERRAIGLAIRTQDVSLVETLVYRFANRFDELPDLRDLALFLSDKPPVRNALIRRGLIPTRDRIARIQKRYRDLPKNLRNLFGAIHRNDEAAVVALLPRIPDLAAKSAEGLTAEQYALAIGRDRIAERIRDVQRARTGA